MPNRVLTTPVTELDFLAIKENLKSYLSNTSEFGDFDYEGAGINVLLDLLAYNTHYTALYANMVAAESFIDSAVMRRSLVSLGKNLGYVPNSMTAATAVVDLILGTTAGVPDSIPTGTKFFASKDGENYTFSTTDSYKINKDSVPYTVSNMSIRQGVYKSASYVYDSTINSISFEIPSSKIDKSLVRVYVMNSPNDLTNLDDSWKVNDDYLNLDPTTKVFFVNENYRGNYEVSFGDGILGQRPEEKSFIMIVYFQTEGSVGNDIGNTDTDDLASFSFNGVGGDDFNSTVSTITPSFGGSERDTEEQIRYTAPKYYQSQDRTVTISDYESIVLKEYSAADSVRVWGGEENDPPVYGKVFLSILPKNGASLSDPQKEFIRTSVLDKKKIVGITPEIVDPDYTYIGIECFVSYDSSRTTQTENVIKNSVLNAINSYSTSALGRFNKQFRYSSLSRQVDLSNPSIVSNRISTTLIKKLIPFESSSNYSLDFAAQLHHPYDGYIGTLRTSTFKHRDIENVARDCFIEDDGFGKLVMYSIVNGVKTVIRSNIGSIDYITGKVSLISFNPTGTGILSYIMISVVPDQRFDLIPKRNQIIKIDSALKNSVIITVQDVGARIT